jgi:hypothetical protein
MDMFWFGIIFGAVGLVYLLSGIYNWVWWWKMNRGIYFINKLIGINRIRFFFTAIGTGMIGVAIGIVLGALSSTNGVFTFVVSMIASISITTIWYSAVNNESFFDLLSAEVYKEKPKNDDENID